MLAFLSYNLQRGVSIWLCHGELSNSLWILDLLSPFYLLLFPCYKWSLSSFNVKFFPSVTSSVTSSSFLLQLHSLLILTNLSSLSSSECRSKVSWMVTVSKIPMVNYFFCNFVYFLLEFHFHHYHCFFGSLSSCLYSVLFRLSIFKKMAAAAAAAKLLQSCPILCDSIDGSPPGSPVPGILQARTLEWVAISFSNAWKWKVKVKLLSRVWLLATPWTAAHQAPPSLGFSRQEYWSGVPLPSPKKMACGFITGKQGGSTTTHFAVYQDRLWIKWHDWLLIMMDDYVVNSDLWTEELVVKFILYAITHSYYTV